jgi:hypothetical protein
MLVNGPRDELLAGAAFSGNEHGFRGGRDLSQASAKLLHQPARPAHLNDLAHRRRGSHRRSIQGTAVLQGPTDKLFELIDVERLFDVIERTLPHRLDGRRHRGIRRGHENLCPVRPARKLAHELQSVHAGHLQIGDDHVVTFVHQAVQRLDGARDCIDVMPGLRQDVAHRGPRLRMIVNDQHPAVSSAGHSARLCERGSRHAAASMY